MVICVNHLIYRFKIHPQYCLSQVGVKSSIGGVFISLETACPMANFVKNSVNWGQVVLIWLQVCHFCEKLGNAESPVIPTVFGLSKTLVVLWRSWHPRRKANSRVHSLHFKIHYNYYVTLMQTPRMPAYGL